MANCGSDFCANWRYVVLKKNFSPYCSTFNRISPNFRISCLKKLKNKMRLLNDFSNIYSINLFRFVIFFNLMKRLLLRRIFWFKNVFLTINYKLNNNFFWHWFKIKVFWNRMKKRFWTKITRASLAICY